MTERSAMRPMNSSPTSRGPESADADVEFVRRQRRFRGEPSMSRKEALWRANQHLRAES